MLSLRPIRTKKSTLAILGKNFITLFNESPFRDLEDHIERGSALVGSPDRIIEKLLDYYNAFGHQVQMISVEGLELAEQQEQLERFATEIIPVLKREIPNSVWEVEQPSLV